MLDSTILNMMINDLTLFNKSRRLIKPMYFTSEYVKFLYMMLNEFYEIYGKFPSSIDEYVAFYNPKLRQFNIINEIDLKGVLNEIYRPSSYDEELTYKTVSNFISQNLTISMINDVKDAIELPDQSSIDERISAIVNQYIDDKSFNLLTNENPLVKLNEIDTINNIITSKSSPDAVIKSCISTLNNCLQYKGYVKGDVGMVIAPPGTGKSTFLVSEGAYAAQQGYKVLHILIGDMDESDGILKYISNILSIPQDILINQTPDDRLTLLRTKGSMTNVFSLVNIKTYAPDEISANELYKEVFKIQKDERTHYDMIIVDYPENLLNDVNDSMYMTGDKNYKTLAKIAKKNHCVVLTGSQPKSVYWNHEIIPMDAAAESSKKQHHVDHVFTIGKESRTSTEQVSKFNICKVRRGSKNMTNIRLQGEFSRVSEISTNEYEKVRASASMINNIQK